jgi:hypothetical protein
VGRMVSIILGLATVPTPDDAADALAIAIWAANRERVGDLHTSAVFDRSAVAPMAEGVTPFERAVREAIAKERRATKSAKAEQPRSARRRAS